MAFSTGYIETYVARPSLLLLVNRTDVFFQRVLPPSRIPAVRALRVAVELSNLFVNCKKVFPQVAGMVGDVGTLGALSWQPLEPPSVVKFPGKRRMDLSVVFSVDGVGSCSKVA